jgi:hypothetical protein
MRMTVALALALALALAVGGRSACKVCIGTEILRPEPKRKDT